MCEERGFESLFFTDHTHIPASRETPYPVGGELPHEYKAMHDPFIALTAAAAATTRLLVGTGVCLVIERDPIVTAKQAASVDVLSGGRLLFGVGAGWNLEEMRNHGTDPARRFGRLRESVEAIKEIWLNEEATYAGEQIAFERIWCWPKPLQQPHPPILVGGHGKGVLDRVIAYGDEWLPNHFGDSGAPRGADRETCREGGAKLGAASCRRRWRTSTRRARPSSSATPRPGVHRVLYSLAQSGEADAERRLDRYAERMREYESAG